MLNERPEAHEKENTNRGLACDVTPWQCHGDALRNGGQNTLGLWRVALQDGRCYHGEKMRARPLCKALPNTEYMQRICIVACTPPPSEFHTHKINQAISSNQFIINLPVTPVGINSI